MNFKITTKIYLIILLPIAVVLYLSGKNVLYSYEQKSEYQHLYNFSIFSQLLIETLYLLREERDMSLLYLDGKSDVTSLRQSYDKSDEVLKHLLKVEPNLSYKIKHLELTRKKIIKKSMSHNVTNDFYINFGRYMLNFLQKHELNSNDAQISRYAYALKEIILLRELANEENSIIYNISISGDIDLYTYHKLQTNNTLQNTHLNSFRFNIKNKTFIDMLEKIRESDELKQIEKYRAEIYSSVEKKILVGKIRSIIGYGGLIHTFKNYVLRRKERYLDKFDNEYELFRKYIEEYLLIVPLSKREYNDLNTVADTFKLYKKNIYYIKRALLRKPIAKVDALVKISDKPALQALDRLQNRLIDIDPAIYALNSYNYQQKIIELQNIILQEMNKAIAKLNKEANYTFTFNIALNIIFIVLLIILSTLVGRSIITDLQKLAKGFDHFFAYLNHETTQPKAIKIEGKNELSIMAEEINEQVELISKHREKDEDFIVETTNIVTRMKEGDFDEHIYLQPHNPSLIKLSAVFNDLIKIIQDKIKEQTDELEMINADLSDQVYQKTQQLQEKIKKLNEFQLAINESVMVCYIDKDGKISEYNELFAQYAKIEGDSYIGKDASLLLDEEDREQKLQEILAAADNNAIYKGILKMRTSSGEAFYTNSTLMPLEDSDGSVGSILGLHYDITSVIKARDEAIRAEKSKDEFLSNMSHEIRTPLNAILGFVAILQKKIDDEKHLHYLNIIAQSGESLLHIINDILDFSKIQSGKFTISKHSFEPLEEFSDSVKLFSSKAFEKNIKHYLYIDKNMPECLYSDAIRIKQILSNLLSNAIKFTPENGIIKISIVYKSGHLHINVQDNGIGIEQEAQKRIFKAFEQVDGSTTRQFGGTGLGLSISSRLAKLLGGKLTLKSEVGEGSIFTLKIPAEKSNECSRTHFHTERLANLDIVVIQNSNEGVNALKLIAKYFNDFGVEYRTERTSASSAGADLVVVYDDFADIDTLINEAKAVIVLEDKLSRKYENYKHVHVLNAPYAPLDTMRVLDEATEETIEDKMSRKHEEEEATTTVFDAHILIAEDNKTNQMLIKTLMDQYGITYDIAADGVEAVKFFEKNRNYDLVLIDENMPNLNGIGAMKRMKAYEKEHNITPIPIVALTANVFENARKNFLKEGMDDFIGKPIEEKELLRVLQKYLKVKNET